MDCSPPGSSFHGILQARTLEWVAVPSSRSSQPRDQTQVSCITGRFFTMWSTREALKEKRLLSKYDFPPGLSSFSVVLGAMSVQLLTMISSYFHPQGRGIECSRASGQDWVDLHGRGNLRASPVWILADGLFICAQRSSQLLLAISFSPDLRWVAWDYRTASKSLFSTYQRNGYCFQVLVSVRNLISKQFYKFLPLF